MDPIRLNFATLKRPYRKGKRLAMGVVIAVLVAVSLVNLYTGLQHFRQLTAYRGKVAKLEQQASLARRGPAGKVPTEGETGAMNAKVRTMANIVYEDIFPWTKVLDALETILPPGARVETLNKKKAPDGVLLGGSAGTTGSVAALIQGLDSQACFQNSRLLAISIQTGKSTGKMAESAPVHFEIETRLVPGAFFPGGEYDNTKRYLIQ
jgi:Tfp pilus assembly protein PilN